MRIHSSIVLGGVLAASLVCAENLTQANVEKAQAVIDAAVQAYGGEDKLSEMNTLIIEHETVNIAVGQSRSPEPPWDRNPASGVTAIDYGERVFVTRNSGTGGGFEFDSGTVIDGEDSYQLNFRAGTSALIAEPDFDTTSGPFMRITPALLVRQVSDRAQNAYYLGEVEIDDDKLDVVGFSMAVGPAISLYFDRDTRLLKRSERVIPAFGLVEYRFNDYERVDGIPFNQLFELYLNGDHNMLRTNLSTSVNKAIGTLADVDDSLLSVPAIVPAELSRQEIAEGVYQIGGNGTYAMFVEMDDYVIAVGGTAGIPDRIEKLREVLPDKPIRYGVMTHHHFDHVLGVPAYEEEGATIITATAHEAIVREAADDPEAVKIKAIDGRKVIEDSSRRVEIVDIGPTAHTENLLIAYLPQEGILFEADHFAMPQTGPVPPAVSSTRTFAAALQANDIAVEKIVSAHSPRVGTMADLHAALEKESVQVGQN